MQIMAAMYEQLLENEGYDVTTKLVTTRDVYCPSSARATSTSSPTTSPASPTSSTPRRTADAPLVSSNDPDGDARRARAARRGEGHLDPAAVGGDRPERLLRDPGLRRREQPRRRSPTWRRSGQPIKLGAPRGLRGPRRLRGRADRRLRLRHHRDRAARLRQRPGQGRRHERRGRSWARPAPPTARSADLGLVLLEDDKGIQPAQNLIPAVNADFLGRQPGHRGRVQRAVRGADHRGPGRR